MELYEQQKDLDRVKWNKSVELGADACGSFNYCKCCEKHLDNPCARALNRMNGMEIPTSYGVAEYKGQLPVEVEEKPLVEVEPKPLVEVKPAKKTTKNPLKKAG